MVDRKVYKTAASTVDLTAADLADKLVAMRVFVMGGQMADEKVD